MGGQRRAVLTADEFGCKAPGDDRLLERGQGVVGVDVMIHDNHEGPGGALIDNVDQDGSTAVHGLAAPDRAPRHGSAAAAYGVRQGMDVSPSRRRFEGERRPSSRHRRPVSLMLHACVVRADPGVNTPVAPARALDHSLLRPRAQFPIPVAICRPVTL